MRVNLACSPSYTLAYCYLAYGESVLVESGAMAAMSAGLGVSAGIGPGGLAKASMRKAFGGESFFMGRYTAEVEGAWVAVAPRYPGDIGEIDLASEGLMLQAGALLAVSHGIDVDVKYAGLRNIVLREGATLLRVTGTGKVLAGSYGGLQRFELDPGESMIIDTGHLVGYSDTVNVRVGPLSSVATSVFTGEGMVAVLTGPGFVYMQTRAEQQIRNWLQPGSAQNTGRA